MKKIFLCASLLLAVALLFIFSSATTKPTVDSHKPVAIFWPGAKVRNNTDWVMEVEILYAGYNKAKVASIQPHTLYTFDGSTNLIRSVETMFDNAAHKNQFGQVKIGNKLMISDRSKFLSSGCGIDCNFTITQKLKAVWAADSFYIPIVTKD